MRLTEAINAFNESTEQKIEIGATRDGRMTAELPRVGRGILVEDATFTENVKVTAADIAWLCEEARRAAAPGLVLLEAALAALAELDNA